MTSACWLLAVVVVVVVRAGVARGGPIRVGGGGQGDGGAHRGVHRLQLGVVTVCNREELRVSWKLQVGAEGKKIS